MAWRVGYVDAEDVVTSIPYNTRKEALAEWLAYADRGLECWVRDPEHRVIVHIAREE